MNWTAQIAYMGQDLLNPPSVEGWHSGVDWINSGSLMKRTNFLSEMIGDDTRPGVKKIISRVKKVGLDPKTLVESCLDVLGPMNVSGQTMKELLEHAEKLGNSNVDNTYRETDVTQIIIELLQLVVSTREYQFC